MSLALLTARSRSLSVEELGTERDPARRPAYLRLKGQWMRKAGFAPGQRVRVEVVAPGELRVSVVRIEPAALESERQAIQARLDAAIKASTEN